MIIAVFSVPAILALTLTLPVVDDGRDGNGDGAIALPVGDDEPFVHVDEDAEIGEAGTSDSEEGGDRLLSPEVGEELHHLVESGFSPLHSPLGRIHHSALRRASHDPEAALSMESGMDEEQTKELLEEIAEEEALDFQPGLAAVQCIAGPAFCGYIIFQGTEYLRWVIIACVALGTVLGVIVATKAVDGTQQPWRLVRCFAGFVCSLVWIAAIADEVVSVLGVSLSLICTAAQGIVAEGADVLQAVGELMGLSDAIIGLTSELSCVYLPCRADSP
jgi:sodium/potassium/calcium exchanger 6